MLVRMTPEQVLQGWPTVRKQIAKALPPQLVISGEAMSNVLYSILMERSQIWVYFREDNLNKPLSMVLTAINIDEIVSTRSLILYAMVALENLVDEDYRTGLNTLHKFAESVKCEHIVAYCDDENAALFIRRGATKLSNLLRV